MRKETFLKIRYVLTSLILILVYIHSPLHSQEKPQEEPQEKSQEDSQEKSRDSEKIKKYMSMSLMELMEVEVTTAGKTAERIPEIPASVVLITRQDIDRFGYMDLAEVLENIPGLYAIDDYGEGGKNFGVRGFWSGASNDNLTILVNGVHQVFDVHSNYPLPHIPVPIEAIDRIEVIRGPMSVIYGNGAFYGVVNIITDETRPSPANMISISGGSAKTKKLFVRLQGKSGEFSYALNTSLMDTHGIDEPLSKMMTDPSQLLQWGVEMDNTTGGKLENNEKFVNFSGQFKDLKLHFSYSEADKEIYFVFPSTAEGAGNRASSLRLSLEYNKTLSSYISLKGKFSYSHSRESYDYKHFFDDFFGIQELSSKGWEAELNTFITLPMNLDITAGVYYRSITDGQNFFDLPSFGVPALEHTRVTLVEGDNIVTRALFCQLTYRPSKHLTFIAGTRLEQSPRYSLQKIHVQEDSTTFKQEASYEQEEIEIIPRFAALFKLNDRNVFKLLYGMAINRPSFFQNYASLFSNIPHLSPEHIQTLEFNYTGILMEKITLNASIFRNSLDNLITRVVRLDENNNYSTWLANAGKMTTTGLELTVKAEPSSHFTVELSGTIQETKDKRAGFENITVAYSPKTLAYIKAAYCSGTWTTSITGNYTGSMETYWDETKINHDGSFGNRIGKKSPGYFVLGAALRIDHFLLKNLFLNLKGSNLLGREIRYPTFTNNEWASLGTIGFGRRFLVSLGWKF